MPSRIGKFEILRPLGRGAMGEVYLAMDPGLGREVALKTIRPDAEGGDLGDLKARFAREAQAAAGLHHPHLVTIFEFGEAEGLLYFAMEVVEGQSLLELLRAQALAPAEFLEVMAQVCDGLQAAHQKGIVHRDIKPANLMVSRVDGRPFAKVLDFGVAKSQGTEATQTGQVVGTIAYMAPEYLSRGVATPSADLFAVAVILYEGLAGHRPFTGDTSGSLIFNILHEPPPELDPQRLAGLGPGLQSLLRRSLAKDPLERYPTARDLAAALRAAQDPTWKPEETPTVALPRTGSRIRPRRPLWVWGLAAVLLLAVATGGWYALRKDARPSASVDDAALRAAERLMDKDPLEALRVVQAVLREAPPGAHVDPDALALLLVLQYRAYDLEGFLVTLRDAKARGVTAAELLQNKAYKAMLLEDRKGHQLPERLRQRLLKGEEERAD